MLPPIEKLSAPGGATGAGVVIGAGIAVAGVVMVAGVAVAGEVDGVVVGVVMGAGAALGRGSSSRVIRFFKAV